MKSASIAYLAAVAGLAALFVARGASALGPVDVEIAAKLGGGTNPLGGGQNVFGVGGPNALDFGGGLRAGASLSGFYGGLSLVYYGGASQDVLTAQNGLYPYSAHEEVTSLLYGIEVGYNLHVPWVTIRPQLGVGSLVLRESGFVEQNGLPSTTSSRSTSNLYLEPGVTGLRSFGPLLVGADANVLVLPGTTGSQPAFTAHIQVGVRL
jgi:hypothetical protein